MIITIDMDKNTIELCNGSGTIVLQPDDVINLRELMTAGVSE